MLTVRFPSGASMMYNDVSDVTWDLDRANLIRVDTAGKRWLVAHVLKSSGAALEWTNPCTVTAAPVASVKSALELLDQYLIPSGSLGYSDGQLVAKLKTKLRRFDARRGAWK